jgi:hypothetical protein
MSVMMPTLTTLSQCFPVADLPIILGLHRILPMAYRQESFEALWSERLARLEADPQDAGALMDLSIILQSLSQTQEARVLMDQAIAIRKDYAVIHGDGTGPRLLALVTAGDFMANTPVDFLLNGSNAVLILHYVDAATPDLDDLPDHDIAFFGISEANGHEALLARMALLLPTYRRPMLNRDPGLIAGLTRDGVSAMLADEPAILAPRSHRVSRAQLAAIASGEAALGDHLPLGQFPVIVRPVGTHAGHGMTKILAPADLLAFAEGAPDDPFYLSPFVDYRGVDGLYNKQRVVLIDGKPYASHMALSDHWMVHYLNAGMGENAKKRAVEADWMEHFDTDFAQRHAAAFEALTRHIGLDYFGIDCAELPDGRLLVFEVDVAMIVHDMDDTQTFPYKQKAMRKLFDAFMAAADRKRRQAVMRAA